MTREQISTLVLYANYTNRISYFDDWYEAFAHAPLLRCTMVDICRRDAHSTIKRHIRDAELIVLLHSTNGDTTMYLEPLAATLADRRGVLVSFVGNEVNLASSPISDKRAVFSIIRPDYVATQLLLEAGEYLWGDLVEQRVLAIPHALNPQAFRPETPRVERSIDIGVRAVRYQASLGDNDRNELHDLFASPAIASRFAVDISTDRLDRHGWARFLNSCRATVSSEASGWYLERDDATVLAIQQYAREQSRGSVVISSTGLARRIGHRTPWWVRRSARRLLSRGPLRFDDSTLELLDDNDVQARFFDRPKPDFYAKCVSSRHFDAIGAGTTQVLLEGRYNDLLRPGEHYIELKRGYSNLEQVCDQLTDDDVCAEIAARVHTWALECQTYQHRIDYLIQQVDVGRLPPALLR